MAIERPGQTPADRTRFLEEVIRRLKNYGSRILSLENFFSAIINWLWTDWTPTISVVAPMTISSVSVSQASYLQIGKFVFVRMRFSATIGGTPSSTIRVTTPVDPNIGALGLETVMPAQIVNSGLSLGFASTQGFHTPRRFDLIKPGGFASGSCAVSLSGYYLAQ